MSSVNREMLALYWDIGKLIEKRQEIEGWGSGVIPRLSRDLRNELPEIKGFSERNLKRMIRFYREYPSLIPSVPQPVALMEEGRRDEEVPQGQLRHQGTPIPINELWIAALVVQHHLALSSRDRLTQRPYSINLSKLTWIASSSAR